MSMNRFSLWINRYLLTVATVLSLAVSIALAVTTYTVGALSNPIATASVVTMFVLSVVSLILLPKYINRGRLYTGFIKFLFTVWVAIAINTVPGIVIPDNPPLPLWIRIVFALLPIAHIAWMMKLGERLKHRIEEITSKHI